MSARSKEGKLFRAYKRQLEAELGNKALDNVQIDRIGKREFGSRWGGCRASDYRNIEPNKFYVFNTDPAGKPGEHWMAGVSTPKRLYLYDSYSRDAPRLLPEIAKKAKGSGLSLPIQTGPKHPEQIGYTSEVCGHYSLAFLFIARDLGIRAAAKLI